MSVAELKELVHQRVNEVEDGSLLEEVLRFLKPDDRVEEPGMLYFMEEGKKEIDQAIGDIERGDYHTHEEFAKLMKECIERHRDS